MGKLGKDGIRKMRGLARARQPHIGLRIKKEGGGVQGQSKGMRVRGGGSKEDLVASDDPSGVWTQDCYLIRRSFLKGPTKEEEGRGTAEKGVGEERRAAFQKTSFMMGIDR